MPTYLNYCFGQAPIFPASAGNPIQVTGITLNLDNSWTFTWDATDASYYRIVLNGTEIARVTTPKYRFAQFGWDNYPPPLEIMNSVYLAPSEKFLPYLVIQWYQVPCNFFVVNQYVNGSWQQLRRVINNGSWVFTIQTPLLTDETTNQYQVIAVDSIGQQSPPLDFLQYTVCPPTLIENDITIGYNQSSQNITIEVS